MAGIYIFVIVLNVFLISIIFIKTNLKFRYEITDTGIIKSYINISVLRFNVYEKNSESSINNIISIYINNNRKKEEKINLEVKDTKDTFKQIIREISKEKVQLDIFFGIKESIMPIYVIPTFSTIFSIYLVNNIKEKYIKNIQYNIFPDYIRTYILININIKFDILSLIKVLYLKNKYKEEKNGKSSNWKFND